MPVYLLGEELIFPPPEGASDEGIVAVGGDFDPRRLILAYSEGIFPWPTTGFPLLWFSPDPRFLIELPDVHVSRSLRKVVRREPYEITVDTAFESVIVACGELPRPTQAGTWITDDLVDGYLGLHELGLAHSVEAWEGDELVGGLYGVSLGGVFFGESMFARRPDASKVAFVTLLGHLVTWGFAIVDCQVYTEHLARFGAVSWPRSRFLAALHEALTLPTRRGRWRFTMTPAEALERLVSPGAPRP
ncbi:MAG: leucyl/phenylalanyl-tRNA--protein transferase [Sandaracinaceae bacterium]|nr:leucyl/phenylalanyl-tRNA--protein transferase [Sandaracinaceae bacterium]